METPKTENYNHMSFDNHEMASHQKAVRLQDVPTGARVFIDSILVSPID